MKVGDKKQATILMIVAVGAIAFLVIQFIPKGKQALARVIASAVSKEPKLGVTAPDNSLPAQLQSDPFSHPLLATKLEVKATDSGPTGAEPPGDKMPYEPPRGDIEGPQLPAPTGDMSKFGSVKNAGINQEVTMGVGQTISLRAVMRVNSQVAILGLAGDKEISVK
jgi:hypothetical protein